MVRYSKEQFCDYFIDEKVRHFCLLPIGGFDMKECGLNCIHGDRQKNFDIMNFR